MNGVVIRAAPGKTREMVRWGITAVAGKFGGSGWDGESHGRSFERAGWRNRGKDFERRDGRSPKRFSYGGIGDRGKVLRGGRKIAAEILRPRDGGSRQRI